MMYEFNHPDFGSDYERLGPAIQKQLDWVWATHPDEDVRRGLDLLEKDVHEMQSNNASAHSSSNPKL